MQEISWEWGATALATLRSPSIQLSVQLIRPNPWGRLRCCPRHQRARRWCSLSRRRILSRSRAESVSTQRCRNLQTRRQSRGSQPWRPSSTRAHVRQSTCLRTKTYRRCPSRSRSQWYSSRPRCEGWLSRICLVRLEAARKMTKIFSSDSNILHSSHAPIAGSHSKSARSVEVFRARKNQKLVPMWSRWKRWSANAHTRPRAGTSKEHFPVLRVPSGSRCTSRIVSPMTNRSSPWSETNRWTKLGTLR